MRAATPGATRDAGIDIEARSVTSAAPLRIAMAVYGDLTHDSRVQREARTLATAGHEVTLFCLSWSGGGAGALGREVAIVPLMPSASGVVPGTRSPFHERGTPSPAHRLVARTRWLAGYVANLRSWGAAVVRAAGPVDAWHLHDFAALVAVGGRVGRVPFIYDVHDLFTETGTGRNLPGPLRRAARAVEARLARRATLVVAVNAGIASVIARRTRARPVIVVHNAAPRWTPPEPRPDLLRQRLALGPATPVILYHGLLSEARGLDRLCEAMLEPALRDAHLALLGYGHLRDRLIEAAAEPRFGGRVHVLDAVAPDDLLAWVASADVGAMAMPGTTRNLRLSTPNKLFECLAAGTPVVVSDFPLVRAIVLDDPLGPLGAACDPSDASDLARALAGILGLDRATYEALRRRCLAAAAARWNWESEVTGLLAAYAGLAATRAASAAGRPGAAA